MFEAPVVEVDTSVGCADALVASIAEERWVTARRFAMVARWADLHHPDRDAAAESARPLPADPRARAAVRRRSRVRVGADGTPLVTDDAIVELGMLLQTTTYGAEALLGDVLELRHRLPRTWDAVLTGRLEGWKARQVAKATRPLRLEHADRVDALVIEALLGLPWGRALAVVEAKVIAVDPTGHEERRQGEEARHYVTTRRRTNAHGVRTLIARAAAGDIARLEAMIAHLAETLRRTGDSANTDPHPSTPQTGSTPPPPPTPRTTSEPSSSATKQPERTAGRRAGVRGRSL